MYSADLIKRVGQVAGKALQDFSHKKFVADVFAPGWDALELKQRVRRIADSIHLQMAGDFKSDVKSLIKLTIALHEHAGRDNTFEYIFLADYAEQYGLKYPSLAFDAMERITILASCEYAVRPYIIADQDGALARMLQWTNHNHASVRRLASEGCRPRLPWAMALPALKAEPSPILPILEKLKHDSSEFVRRSVANNLNDIAKDNPDVVKELAGKWKGQSKEIDKILKHGCRTLLKKGDKDVLGFFGVADNVFCTVPTLEVPSSTVCIGDYLHFSFSVLNSGTHEASLRIEYEILYAKAAGKTGRKIFKISERTLTPGDSLEFSRRQSFADMTTRKHYAGEHKLSVVINGTVKASQTFWVTER